MADAPRDPDFKPELGLWSLTALIVGSIIGSGIFFVPGLMLDTAGTVPLVMAAWVLGGVVALAGAMMFAELGAAYPSSGGQYVFLREAFGRLPSFLFSWTGFTVVQSGTIAAVAVALASAVDVIAVEAGWGTEVDPGLPGEATATTAWLGVELPGWGVAFLAIGVIVLLTAVNYVGVRRAAIVNNASTIAKVAALAAIIVLAVLWGDGSGNFTAGGFGSATVAGFLLALSNSLFAYDGFAQANFVAGEVRDPRRTVPRALVLAMAIVAGVYLLATLAYFHVLDAGSVSDSALGGTVPIATEAVAQVFPTVAASLVAGAIVVSTFGTVNAYILASPRIYHAVARDREFPAAFGVLSRFRTPTYGLAYGAIWAGLLTLSGGFAALSNLVVFGLYVFYLWTALAYFRLLRRDRAAFQSFRAGPRGWAAAFFGLAAVAVVANYAAQDIRHLPEVNTPGEVMANTTLFGLILILSGFIAYVVLRDRGGASTRTPPTS